MYLGLFLSPWVIFFGLSGVLFNHPNVGQEIGVHPIPRDRMAEFTTIEPIDPSELAERVVARLGDEHGSYTLAEDYAPSFTGPLGLTAVGAHEDHTLLINLPRGQGIVLSHPRSAPESVPFARRVDLDDVRFATIEAEAASLLEDLDIEAGVAARRHPGISPQLRFRLNDSSGRQWNVGYDLASGQVDGRAVDTTPALSLHDVLGRMHKTHHFPPELGVRTFWALFADLTGLTLVLWALTGLIMWLQIKKARGAGVVAASVGLLLAAWIMLTLDADLRFGNVQPERPGGASRVESSGATSMPTESEQEGP